MRVLDACLEVLERANERGERRLSTELAQKLERFVPALKPDIPLTEAMDLVFQAQSLRNPQGSGTPVPSKSQRHPLSGTEAVATVDPRDLTAEEATTLTEEIRSHAKLTCLLLARAHDHRAWRALGYRSWAAYGRCEFGISRSRLYELLEQARVLRSLQTTLGLTLDVAPDISPYAALDIKDQLASVAAEVRKRLPPAPLEDQICRAVVDVVAEIRAARKPRQLRAAIVQVSATREVREDENASPHLREAGESRHRLDFAVNRTARRAPTSLGNDASAFKRTVAFPLHGAAGDLVVEPTLS